MRRLDNPDRRRARPVLTVREWWWNRDQRRHIAQMTGHVRRHPLDEQYVVDAMARQLEEIRNLPESTVEGGRNG
jgi:hypothetical protein